MWLNDLNKFIKNVWLNLDPAQIFLDFYYFYLILHVLLIYILKANVYRFRKFWWKVIFITFGLVITQRMSGAGPIIQYSDSLFEMSASNIPPNIACVIIGVFQLIGSGLSFYLIDKVGRRTLLLISSGVITICLMMITIYFKLSNSGIYNFITNH